MAQKPSSVLRDAEAGFFWAVSHLMKGPHKKRYLKDSAALSRDARAFVLGSMARYLYPQISLKTHWDLQEADLSKVVAYFPIKKEDVKDQNLVSAQVLSEMGFFYERMKNFSATIKDHKVQVRSSRTKKKRSGAFFTPLSVCDFMVRAVLDPVIKHTDNLSALRVIDPAMGCGQFILAACEKLVKETEPETESEILNLRRLFLSHSLFGVDLDGENIDTARTLFGLYTQTEDPDLPGIQQGDALITGDEDSGVFGAPDFPEKLFMGNRFDGFDAIIGNPPYVASKNVSLNKYKAYLGGASQIDFYLLFIHKYAVKKYLRPNGGVCFIVPDPMLLRGNAEGARRQLIESLDLEMLLHIKGVFPRTHVANVIFLARRSQGEADPMVKTARLEKTRSVQGFRKNTKEVFTENSRDIPREFFDKAPRKEFRYLQDDRTLKVLKKLDASLPLKAGRGIVIRPLKALCRSKGAIFRGEEIGKERIREFSLKDPKAGPPILIGGENISRYNIRDDGLYIPSSQVKKDPERYSRPKIVLQKSTGRIVAAYDTTGYVVPQSVYGILLDDVRISYPFLLTQLNSRLHNYFMHMMFTGYKMLQPQIEIEDLHQIPVILPEFLETQENRTVTLDTAKSLMSQYIRTDDPGWILEFIDDSLNLGSKRGSAMIHDLLDFLGNSMIQACTEPDQVQVPRERLTWLMDLVIYRVFNLTLEEIEGVESFFADEEDLSDTILPDESEIPEIISEPLKKPAPPVFGEIDPEERAESL